MPEVFATGDSMSLAERESASSVNAKRVARAQYEDALIYVNRDLNSGVISKDEAETRILALKAEHGIEGGE